jgi:gliding motility-associated-like protein
LKPNQLTILKKFMYKIGLVLVCWLMHGLANGQLCNGTLGEPVVNVDFGKGVTEFGPALKAILPNLSHGTGACNPDGQYTIRKSLPTSCFNTWHILNEDHTLSDNDGYMMILNATNKPGDFYIDTLDGLCGNTVYEFAAWVVNLQKIGSYPSSSKPDLQFRIESITGTLLASYNTNSIPETSSPEWKQYGLSFKTPANAQTLVLRIYNAAPAGFGNDFALDDITFRPCGPTLSVSLPGYPNNLVEECFGKVSSVTVQANLGVGYTNPVIIWQQSVDTGKTWTDIPGSGGLNYNFLISSPAYYQIRATVAEASNIGVTTCRIVSNQVTIHIRELAGNGASVNSPVCTNQMIQFNGGDGSNFTWKGPNGFTSNLKNPSLVATTDRTGTYYLDATSPFGCAGKDTLFVQVDQSPVASVSGAVSICENDTVMLNAAGGTTYNWIPSKGLSDPAIAAPIAILSSTVNYSVIVSNGNCADTAVVTVTVSGVPTANAGPDLAIIAGQSVNLQGDAGGTNTTIRWSPTTGMSNSTVESPRVSPVASTTYTMLVESTQGCGSASDDVLVKVFEKLNIPNAFSPNGDGTNDTWRIDALAVYPRSLVDVYDRYGQLVFKSTGYNRPWDGTRNGNPVPTGVYYYLIDTKNGSDVFKGSVMVIR